MIVNRTLLNPRSMTEEVLKNVLDGFGSLRGSPSELWRAYTLKFLDSYSYFSLSVVFTLFLSEDFGYSDYEAGTIYGVWGALVTFLIDNKDRKHLPMK